MLNTQGITTVIPLLYYTGLQTALKLLLCFPLDNDFNDILNYWTNSLLRKCKKAIAKNQDCLWKHHFIAIFHEIVIKCVTELKTQLVWLDISTNHKLGLPVSLYFIFCQMIHLFNAVTMLWKIFIYAAGYLVMTFQRSQPNQP